MRDKTRAVRTKINCVRQREGSQAKEGRREEQKMEKKEETMQINWDRSGLYVPLPSEEDCGTTTPARAVAIHNTAACAEHSPPPSLHQQLASSTSTIYGRQYDTRYDWHHLSSTNLFVLSVTTASFVFLLYIFFVFSVTTLFCTITSATFW